MDRLLVAGQEIPEGSGIFQIRTRVAFLGMYECGELDTITDEEDRCVIPDHIPVAFLRVEFYAEASRIAGGVGGSLLAAHGTETNSNIGLLANLAEEVCGGLYSQLVFVLDLGSGSERDAYQVTDIMSDLELSESTCTLGMHNTLGDTFSVEVSKEVDEVEVLQEDRAVIANCLGGSSEGDRTPI